MTIPFDPKKSKVEKLEKELYSKEFTDHGDIRTPLHLKNSDLDPNWHDDFSPPVEQMPYAKKKNMGALAWFMIVALVFFLGAILYAGFIFFRGTSSVDSNDIDIKIVAPISIGGGEILSMDVVVTNNSKTPIELVDLIVEYPDGTKSAENMTTDLKRIREEVGDIPAEGFAKKTISSVLFGEEGSVKNIKLKIEYSLPNSGAIFDKERDLAIGLSASPIRLSSSGLNEISSGQTLDLTLDLESNSNDPIDKVMLVAEYPFGFKFIDSDIKPNFGDNIWVFDKLFSKEKKQIKIKGKMDGQNNEQRIFRFNAGLQKTDFEEEIGVIFNTIIHPIAIQKSFVDLVLEFNNQNSETVAFNSGDRIDGKISFANNTNDFIQDLEIEIKAEGQVFDESSVTVLDGFYRSIDNTFVWNKITSNDFAEIEPRQNASVGFSFKPYDLSLGQLMIKNPEIKFSAKVKGKRTNTENVEEQVVSDTFKTIKIISDTPTNSYTLYEQGPFANSGPIPPKADTKTTYTAVLEISNNSNDLKNASVSGFLPNYVSWKNNTAPASESVIYDEVTRKITWNIGDINYGTGYSKTPKVAYIQLELLPSVNQVGESPYLINDLNFRAEDSFTGTSISESIKSPTTLIRGYNIVNKHQNVIE